MIFDFIIVFIGLFIQFIFLFKRELLLDNQYKIWIWLISIVLFIIGYLLSKLDINVKTLPCLMIPLLAYGIYRLEYSIFKYFFKAEPVDTFHSRDIKLMKSGIFNFIFWFFGLIIPTIISFEISKL